MSEAIEWARDHAENGTMRPEIRGHMVALLAEVDRLRAMEVRARGLHQPYSWSGTTRCSECPEPWPCKTIKVLEARSV